MQQNTAFSKVQKLIVWLFGTGSFLLGVALSEWILEELNARYDDRMHVTFGLFGLFTIAAAIVVPIVLDEKKDRGPQ